MAREIEAKVKIDNIVYEKVKEKLQHIAQLKDEVVKRDTYFHRAGSNDIINNVFRLREYNGKYIITIKKKSIEDGFEINDEYEFEVSNRDNFIKFTDIIGYKPFIKKIKHSLIFQYREYIIELVNIDGLGSFLEIENTTKIKKEKAINEIKNLFSMLGIENPTFEDRYYIEMLYEKYNNTTDIS